MLLTPPNTTVVIWYFSKYLLSQSEEVSILALTRKYIFITNTIVIIILKGIRERKILLVTKVVDHSLDLSVC
jgi:hypothetical protein